MPPDLSSLILLPKLLGGLAALGLMTAFILAGLHFGFAQAFFVLAWILAILVGVPLILAIFWWVSTLLTKGDPWE